MNEAIIFGFAWGATLACFVIFLTHSIPSERVIHHFHRIQAANRSSKKGSNLKRFPASQPHLERPTYTELYKPPSSPLKSHQKSFWGHTQGRTYLWNVTEELKTIVRKY